MEPHWRNLDKPELQVSHIKQELPEKSKPLLEPVCAGEELYQAGMVSVKEELSEREQMRDETCQEVSCVHIKEEALEPIHIHRVFSDLGPFSAVQLNDKSHDSAAEQVEGSGTISCSLQFGHSKDAAQSGPVPVSGQQRHYSRHTPQHFTIHAECFTPRVNFPRFQHLDAEHKPYVCGACGKTFRRTDHLKRHQSMHLGEKPFHCVRCDKRFSLRRSLETHLRQCAGELTCRCAVCGDVFQSFSNLHRHQLIHNGEKSYECGGCGRRYKQSDYFKRHQKVVSEDRPYYCLDCEKSLRLSPTADL